MSDSLHSRPRIPLTVCAAMLFLLMAGPGCLGRLSGKELVQDRCTRCHTLFPVEAARKTSREWRITVSRMIKYGARLSNKEIRILIDYLTDTYGPDKS
ncbi:MAG: hypothetical protein ACMUIM_04265 [bacterium]